MGSSAEHYDLIDLTDEQRAQIHMNKLRCLEKRAQKAAAEAERQQEAARKAASEAERSRSEEEATDTERMRSAGLVCLGSRAAEVLASQTAATPAMLGIHTRETAEYAEQ